VSRGFFFSFGTFLFFLCIPAIEGQRKKEKYNGKGGNEQRGRKKKGRGKDGVQKRMIKEQV